MSGPTGTGAAYNVCVVTVRRPGTGRAHATGKAYPATVATSPPSPAESNS
jgi:hypothetical protein